MKIDKEFIKNVLVMNDDDVDEDLSKNIRSDIEEVEAKSSIAHRLYSKDDPFGHKLIKTVPKVTFRNSKGKLVLFRDFSFIYLNLITKRSFCNEYIITFKSEPKNQIDGNLISKIGFFKNISSQRYSREFRDVIFETGFKDLNHFIYSCGIYEDEQPGRMGFLCSCPEDQLANIDYKSTCGITHIAYRCGINEALKDIAGLRAKLVIAESHDNLTISVFKDGPCWAVDHLVDYSLNIHSDIYKFMRESAKTKKLEYANFPNIYDKIHLIGYLMSGSKDYPKKK